VNDELKGLMPGFDNFSKEVKDYFKGQYTTAASDKLLQKRAEELGKTKI
jgi:Golgi nucleoside diphosphatase